MRCSESAASRLSSATSTLTPPAGSAGAFAFACISFPSSRNGKRRQRQAHDEFAAPARPGAARLHASAVQRDDALDQRKADAESAMRALVRARELRERLEQAPGDLRRKADAVVLHRHDDLARPPPRPRGVISPFAVRVARGVVEQIREHLREARGIAFHRDALARQQHRQAVARGVDVRAAGLERHVDRALERQRAPCG